MRINSIGTPVVIPPEQSLEVGASREVTRVEARNPGTGETVARPLPGSLLPVPPTGPVAVEAERRQQSRRGEDRRQGQVAVLIDTRVGQRRGQRRRAQDEALPSIDEEA
jgi:hypothetical protein